MLTLPTSPDGFNDEQEVEQVECPSCGVTGYIVPEAGPHDARVPRCEDCIRDSLREDLADARGHALGALDRIQSRGLLPFRGPDGTLIVSVDVRRGPPGEGRYLRKLTEIVDRECPECGHDRADRTTWNIWTCESGETVRCRACEHVIRDRSSL